MYTFAVSYRISTPKSTGEEEHSRGEALQRGKSNRGGKQLRGVATNGEEQQRGSAAEGGAQLRQEIAKKREFLIFTI